MGGQYQSRRRRRRGRPAQRALSRTRTWSSAPPHTTPHHTTPRGFTASTGRTPPGPGAESEARREGSQRGRKTKGEEGGGRCRAPTVAGSARGVPRFSTRFWYCSFFFRITRGCHTAHERARGSSTPPSLEEIGNKEGGGSCALPWPSSGVAWAFDPHPSFHLWYCPAPLEQNAMPECRLHAEECDLEDGSFLCRCGTVLPS